MTAKPRPHVGDRRGRTAAYAAAACAALFAAVNSFWAAGGTAGLHTLGGRIEEMARSGDRTVLLANVVAIVAKLAVALLALALVRPWGRRIPRRPLRVLALSAAALLIAYGGLQTGAVLLVATGLVTPDVPWTSTVLWWRLLLWEPWFLVWGVLLLIAARAARADRHPDAVGAQRK
ncbi:DUF3995 domain-containing protein [Dactylosporangium aurantiacum]|uniref:DUF3995 domain-containing protein n=1 Tax=Dactylosporangium aurantiacum TaxID=35754 RepID=A0A9Q9IS08_9ACTN|nr:DUF3995 domain-containing protein [Dactylosporangium aurantiacum]MDG6107675.1 DUF3995 domain-containing protein [Dactylosporangium aurantiacum]UWZ58732.1 DUF3995 domain-containing protein [Dactylosporangium aurantiacum]